MGPKLLFVLGILAAHGALGAAWMQAETPKSRSPMTTCARVPAPLPHFEPRRELFAMQVVQVAGWDEMPP